MNPRAPMLRCLLHSAALCAMGFGAVAGNLDFLKSAPIAHFRGDDYELMMKNFKEVLQSEAPHPKQAWSNPVTKSSGVAELRARFVATDGAPCKRVWVENQAGGVKGAALYTACHYADRGWLLNPDAVPAAAGMGPKST